jgi:ADP-ribosylglycohydrolase
MRFSVINRFRGTLLGAFLGEILASRKSPHHLSEILMLATERLIVDGTVNLDHWSKLPLAVTDDSASKIIVATLPVALFFHENPLRLRQNLWQLLQIWTDNPVIRDGSLAIGYAIAQSLTEKLDPLTLIPQTVSLIGETHLSQQLLKVNNLLAEGAGLEKLQAELSSEDQLSQSIAMAFYCFLSTWEDFRLAVLRATHNPHLPATGVITGALAGAYNSTVAIPAKWRALLSSPNLANQQGRNYSQMLKLADELADVWSGVYCPRRNSRELEQSAISSSRGQLAIFTVPVQRPELNKS